MEERFAARVVPSAAWAVADAEVVVVAVKPSDVPAALEGCAETLAKDTLVLSIAAGVTIATVEAAAPGRAVVRAMPNVAALVRHGVAAIAGSAEATEAHFQLAERVLGAVGGVVRVSEPLLDAGWDADEISVAEIDGDRRRYLDVEGGVLVGLPRETATVLARQTLAGTAQLLSTGSRPEDLRASVTSPGGTTAAGLQVLEGHAVRAAFIAAVKAATERSKALGRGE
ncbi:MAG: pyrroline-5-carboxylate reductase [Actinobacteria bacterium]|nr:MAG: pyrroline-5-carboxylate reductase [Actinomycetota bacterium]